MRGRPNYKLDRKNRNVHDSIILELHRPHPSHVQTIQHYAEILACSSLIQIPTPAFGSANAPARTFPGGAAFSNRKENRPSGKGPRRPTPLSETLPLRRSPRVATHDFSRSVFVVGGSARGESHKWHAPSGNTLPPPGFSAFQRPGVPVFKLPSC